MAEEKWAVDKLTSNNYATWKFKLKHLLIAKELYGYVDGTEAAPANDATPDAKATYTKNTSKAFSTIVLATSDDLLYLITDCESPKSAWDKLQAHFERDTLANKLFLKKQYFRMVMKESMPIEKHLKDMKDITNKLAAIKAPISEEDQVVTLLGSLPDSYSTLVTALEARVDNLTIDFVQQSLINEEQKRRGQKHVHSEGVSSTDSALAADRQRSRACYLCGQSGHLQRYCPTKPKHQNPNHGTGRYSHNAKQAVETDIEEDDSAFAVGRDANEAAAQSWLVDSGASRHMTPHRNLFSSYTPFTSPEKVGIADGHTVNAVGKGNVQITVRVSRKVTRLSTMYDVLHVPDLKTNLFSVRSATEKGVIVQFGHTRCWLKNSKGMIRAMGTLVDKLYYLDLESSDHTASTAYSDNSLWHQRLAHVNLSTIKQIHRENLVTGADLSRVNVDKRVCEPCVKGKMARKPFKPVGAIKSNRVLELIHTDVCGPMKTVSIGGSRYIVTFIDDYSRYSFVYFVAEKSDVFSKFREFEARVTNQTGLSIGTLRSDGGGEYVSSDFEEYLKDKGIHHELTTRYSPQQNGVAERLNRTICESARSMINHASLPKKFWAEAVATAMYIRNRVPTSAHKLSTTPYELWFGSKPDISNVKVFGCVSYAHVPCELRSKLDDRAEKMVFVGYSTRAKAYRLYDMASQKIVTRRDVVFDETSFDHNAKPVEVPESCSSDEIYTDSSDEQTSGQEETTPQPRRSERAHVPPVRYGIDEHVTESIHHVAYHVAEIVEPQSIAEAYQSPQNQQWKTATEAEYRSLLENETWVLTELPTDRKAVGCRWVFKVKYKADGEVDRYKSRLVAKGYSQQAGIDYQETYSPVVSFPSLRAVLSHAVDRDMVVHQMDVVTAFLNGNLDEDIYMTQPPGFIEPGQESLVCKLNKSLYGLKQSPRCWNVKLDGFLQSLGFSQSSADQCIYMRVVEGAQTIIAVYVDDLIIMSDTSAQLNEVKKGLSAQFKMKDLGEIHHCLGISVTREGNSIKLSQQHYIDQLLKRFGMEQCNTVATPAAVDVKLEKDDGSRPADQALYQSIIGSLIYAASATRPDIAFSVGVLSKFNATPTETHMTAAKRVLRYLKGTRAYGIVLTKSASYPVVYSDASWADNIENRRSTSGNVFIMSQGPISWSSKQQSVVALSTAEAEYISASEATKEASWLRQLLADLKGPADEPITLYVDNQSAIAISNKVDSKRTKHIDIRYHYIRDEIAQSHIKTHYCPSADMKADILTKPLARDRFVSLRDMLGMRETIG